MSGYSQYQQVNNPNIKRNFIYSGMYQVLKVIIPLFSIPYLSRVLGADGMGTYAYYFTIADYFALFCMLGVKNYGARTIATIRNNREDVSKVFWEIYSFQLFAGCAVSIIYLFFCFFVAYNILYAVLTIGLVLAAMLDISWLFSGLEDFRKLSIRDITVKIFSLICIILFVRNDGDIWVYLLISSISSFVTQVWMWFLANNTIHFISPNIKNVLLHAKSNLILFLPTIAVSIYTKMDRLMLGIMAEPKELGYYDASEKIQVVVMALVVSINTVMLPRMSYLYANKKENAEEVFYRSLDVAMLIASGATFIIMSATKEFVPLFYGVGYEKCEKLYYWMLLSSWCVALTNTVLSHYIIPKHKDSLYVWARVVAAGTNLFLNFILIPRYKSIGASAATLVAELCVCSIQLIVVRKEINIYRCMSYASISFMAGIISFLIVFTLNIPIQYSIVLISIKVLTCSMLYLLFLIVLRKVFIVKGKSEVRKYENY